MADFCQQCSVEIFGEDFGDMSGLSQPHDTLEGHFPVVLCEDCGPIQVDHTGKCISADCLKKHGASHD